MVAAWGGVTSQINQCSGSCPGNRVIPRDPVANGPSSSNSAGASSQLAILVQYCQATVGLAFVSIKWVISQGTVAMNCTSGLNFSLLTTWRRCSHRTKPRSPQYKVKATISPCSANFIRLVNLMADKIWVESEVGHGLTFYSKRRFPRGVLEVESQR